MKSASLKVRWLAAFLTVIIIMSAASFTGSMLTLRAVEKDADRSHENSAAFMKNMLDDFWKRVYDYSWQIINASDARQMEREGVDTMRPNAYAFSLEFRNYTQSNTMVEDLYLYFPTSDTVIGTKGVYAKHIYWAALYGINGEISEDDWQTNFFENRTSGYFTVKNGNHPELFYRMSSVKANGRILIAKIRTEELERTLNWICSNSETSFLAMSDEIGNVYAYAGNYDRFANAETNTVSTVVGKEYLFTENPSDLTGLSYVTITEKSTAYRLIVGIMRVSFISLLIAFAVSLVLAIVFVRRSLRPVEKIIEKLHPGELPEGNEISFIDQQIDALLAENRQSVDQLMKERNTMARRTFLSEALKFDTVMQRDIEIIAGFYGQEFENERYVVIVRERSGEDNSSRILQYLSEFEENPAILCWTQKQDLDVFFLNYDEVAWNGRDDLEDFLKDLKTYSAATSRIVCSKSVAYLEQIRNCYLECLQKLDRLESTLMTGPAELKKKEAGFQLGVFQSYLYDEDYLAARSMVPEIGRQFEEAGDNLSFMGQKYYLLTWLQIKKHSIPQEMIRRFIDETDPGKAKKYLYDILTELDKQKRADSLSAGIDDIAGKARCIIDESYDNPMLGLCMLSEQICFSQSYISRAFKEKYGIGVSQYINQVRIAHAKELILNGSQNIKEIALQVGFSGDAQFIRVFKKFEDVTPGAFRAESEQRESEEA